MRHIALVTIKRMSASHNRRAVSRYFGIPVIIQPYVHPQSRNRLGQRPVDLSCRSRSGRDRTAGVRKAPSGRRVPHVLNRGVVVQGNAQDHIVAIAVRASERQVMGIANIGIVYPKMIGDAVVSQLYERAEVVGDFASVKQAGLLREKRSEGTRLNSSHITPSRMPSSA